MIPIFRARKIDSDEYAIGYLMSVVEYENLCCLRETEANYVGGDICDLLTLSIHFPDNINTNLEKVWYNMEEISNIVKEYENGKVETH